MESDNYKEPRWSPFSLGYRFVLLGCVLLAGSGCWEEIQYTPSESPTTQPTEIVSETVEPIEEPSAQGPTSDELFGSSTDQEFSLEGLDESAQEETVAEQIASSDPQAEQTQVPEPKDDSFENVFGPGNDEPKDDSGEPLATEREDSSEPAIPEIAEVLRPSRTALATWRMSSRWSYAAAIYAKGLGNDFYGDPLQQAAYAAQLLDMELPEFPDVVSEDRQAAIISFLLDAGRTQIAEKLDASYSPEYAALAELAIKTNVLLLVYTPKSQHLEPIVGAIRRAAEESTLPSSLWAELVELLEQRASFSEVKAAVLRLHQQVGDYLGGSAD